MRVSSLLFIAFFCQLCYGKGGNKRYHYGENGPCNNSKKAQSTPQPTVTPPSQPTPIVDSKSKVDTSLFNVVDSVEDNVKVLKLTAKEGTSTNKLTYGSDTIWPGKKDVMCLSAVLYLDRDQPTLAVIRTKGIKSGAEFTVYKYHNGKKWKNGNESNHKKKLKELQDAAKEKESTETVGDNVEEKARPADKPVVAQQALSTPTQQAVKPVTASSGKADVLDLTSPDESKVDILRASRNEVEKESQLS
ncbi:signal peptide containing protein [Theileria equi strain WA]|uniref:Signal peptide containing protein n=1 Tax=Theileria equi strain WA TaxID=1537102 RepID=L1LAF8_THEEQ|nr:signal peptide containing protein [Theileria equi strain WA]EKX72286.1 signal peptide containing protein [Theileria equi strain WA]|eukprot:XP_004831738.1 signal peptide containing protein [Theileria equi strain WA]